MAQLNLRLDGITPLMEPTARWASALAYALARDELAGRRPARLTEPEHATWARFKGRLESPDLLALLFENAAVTHAVPFAAEHLGQTMRLDRLPASTVDI